MVPAQIDNPPENFERPQPRRWQYPIYWNNPYIPRGEGVKLAPFLTLRNLADSSSFIRACIDRRKEEILSLEWDITPTKEATLAMGKDRAARDDFAERRLKLLNWWKNPDPEYNTFYSWFKAVLEDIFVIDALSLYLAPPKVQGKGLFGSDLSALCLVAGETIRPLLDLHGGTPEPPTVAYQQFLWGVPRLDMIDVRTQHEIDEELGEPDKEFRGDQLLYLPFDKRSTGPYGTPHVEKCMIPGEIEIQKQKYVKAYYDEGNVPAAWIVVGNADTPQQVRQWQDSLDATIGDLGIRHEGTVLPDGSHVIDQKPNAFQDQYDVANKEEILAVFGLTAMDMGMLPGGKSAGMGGNKGMQDAAREIRERVATKPLLRFLNHNIFDYINQEIFGQRDMKMTWLNMEDSEDSSKMVNDMIVQVKEGALTRDEMRAILGREPYQLALTANPTVDTPTGPINLASPNEVVNPDLGTPVPNAARANNEQNPNAASSNSNPQITGGHTAMHESAPSVSSVQDGASGSAKPAKSAARIELEKLANYMRHKKPLEKFQATHIAHLYPEICTTKSIDKADVLLRSEEDYAYGLLVGRIAREVRSARKGITTNEQMHANVATLIKNECVIRDLPVAPDIAEFFSADMDENLYWKTLSKLGKMV